jgi:translocation and assembly module TamA
MQQVREESLLDCLSTRERDRFTIRVGALAPVCNQPPFTSAPPELALWSWPWTEWPSFSRGIFDQDLSRIIRWYRARGFYQAEVRHWHVDPPEAGRGKRCASDPCSASVHVLIHEGEPVRVHSVAISGIAELPPEVRKAVQSAVELVPGDRFDEVDYDRAKRALRDVLRSKSYAAARVDGSVEIDALLRRARVQLQAKPGGSYEFGELRITGQGRLPVTPIRVAAALEPGEPYRPSRVEEVRVEVLALGAFSSVEVHEKVDSRRHRVEVTLALTPRERDTLRLGTGISSGASRRTEGGDLESIPQWDIHLSGSYERRHLAGTLGSLRIEERPRIIFGEAFPQVTTPALGNIVSLKVHEPAIIEARTDLFGETAWDYGPDPFLGFTRSDITMRVGVRRAFFARDLMGTLGIQQDLFLVADDADNATSDGSPIPSSYRYGFLQQNLKLDLRNPAIQPSSGAYFALEAAESLRSALSDWTSVRLTPDVRFYLPLPLSSTLAFRAALGALFIFEASSSLDDLSRRLGPSSYRLRGGGANSVRGFLPGELGAGSQGGVRRWESMLEWRLRLGQSLTVVTFIDVGDVNDGDTFRFEHLNTSAGFGFRYFTLIGPLRLDAGFRIVDWQNVGGSDEIEEGATMFPLTNAPGALHLTIGDSF